MKQGNFNWNFYRIGGLDQVALRSAEELRRLGELDAKLWVVLSLPIASLRFDKRTLAFVDKDGDGRIRMPEITEAVQWTVERLQAPESMATALDALPLASIRQDTEEGQQILASAKRILIDLGKPDAVEISCQDASLAVDNAVRKIFNGDGVLALCDFDSGVLDADMRDFLKDVMATSGSTPDASGLPGVSQDIANAFWAELKACLDWESLYANLRATHQENWPLGEETQEAYGMLRDLTPHIEDYFLRCELVDYDARSADRVNAQESVLDQLGGTKLAVGCALLETMPLARADAGKPLPLAEGLNPAWVAKVRDFARTVVTPLLGEKKALSKADWLSLKDRFAPYADLLDSRPTSAVQALGLERLRALAQSDMAERFAELVQRDVDAAPEVARMCDVEKLVLFHRYLHPLLMNFVSFLHFYSQEITPFEVGTLFIDGRACKLCLQVDNIDEHAARSAHSYLCLAYCTCTRKESDKPLHMVAVVTAGTDERLTAGRHGVFVDRDGMVWDATLVKLVSNPISIRTAMLAPYRRMARMVTDQIEKFTAAKDQSVTAQSGQAIEKALSAPASAGAPAKAGQGAGPAKTPPPFDIGKSMGIFAAIGLALGALGTAVASIAASLMSLQWWQFPLLIVGIFLIISGPSMLLAWLKLRQRALGPVLNASGWAVNSRIPINFMLGHVLTDSACLPHNAERSLNDPFKKPGFWKGWMTAVLLLCFLAGCAAGAWWGWQRYQEQTAKAPTVIMEGAQPSDVAESEPAPASPPAPAEGSAVPEEKAAPPAGGA